MKEEYFTVYSKIFNLIFLLIFSLYSHFAFITHVYGIFGGNSLHWTKLYWNWYFTFLWVNIQKNITVLCSPTLNMWWLLLLSHKSSSIYTRLLQSSSFYSISLSQGERAEQLIIFPAHRLWELLKALNIKYILKVISERKQGFYLCETVWQTLKVPKGSHLPPQESDLWFVSLTRLTMSNTVCVHFGSHVSEAWQCCWWLCCSSPTYSEL